MLLKGNVFIAVSLLKRIPQQDHPAQHRPDAHDAPQPDDAVRDHGAVAGV
jgi:hypothetical protein